MAHAVSWLIENRIILHKYIGVLTMDDMITVSSVSLEMISDLDIPVHVIGDLSEMTSIHPNFGNLPELTQISRSFTGHPSLGTITAYGTSNKFVNFIGSIIFQLSKKNWKLVDSYEDAVKTLMRIDPSLENELGTL